MNKADIISSGQGEKLAIANGVYRIVVSGDQTNGAYAMIEMNVPPNAGPIPHRHAGFEETFLVLEGEVEFTSEDGSAKAAEGDLIRIPKNGPIHCFKNKTDANAKLLCTVIPAGLDAFFREAAEAAKSETADTLPQTMKRLSAEYGQELFAPDHFQK